MHLHIASNMLAEHSASAALHVVPLDGGFSDEAAQAASDRFQKLEADVLQIREAIKRFAERTERALAGLVSDSAGVAKLTPQERNQQRTAAEITEPIPQRQEHVSCPGSCNICSSEQCRPGFGDRCQATVRFTDSSAREETDPVLAVGDSHLTSVTGEKFDLWKAGRSSFVPIPKDIQAELVPKPFITGNVVPCGGDVCVPVSLQNVQISGSMADGHEVPARADEVLRVIKENHAEKYLEIFLKMPRRMTTTRCSTNSLASA